MRCVFELFYLPDIQYFSTLLRADELILEKFSRYQRQTYRNRTAILTANGVQTLSIPVLKNTDSKIVKDIKIAYHEDWQKKHWVAIESAYKSSPFFECIAHDVSMFYCTKTKYLWDFNLKFLYYFLDLLEINVPIGFTSSFIKTYSDMLDYRGVVAMKENHTAQNLMAYPQVFSNRFGFQANLSILDLVCNQGRNSYSILNQNERAH